MAGKQILEWTVWKITHRETSNKWQTVRSVFRSLILFRSLFQPPRHGVESVMADESS